MCAAAKRTDDLAFAVYTQKHISLRDFLLAGGLTEAAVVYGKDGAKTVSFSIHDPGPHAKFELLRTTANGLVFQDAQGNMSAVGPTVHLKWSYKPDGYRGKPSLHRGESFCQHLEVERR